MKSGQRNEDRLIGPGDNNYGRDESFKIDYDQIKREVKNHKPVLQTELTLELADKIWNQIQNKIKRQKESKEEVLHHLKQIKAQIGKLKKTQLDKYTIIACEEIIDKKIEKIKKL